MNIESLNNWSATIINSRCHLGYYGSNVDWVMLDKSQREGGMIMDFGNDMPDYESDDFDNYNYD